MQKRKYLKYFKKSYQTTSPNEPQQNSSILEFDENNKKYNLQQLSFVQNNKQANKQNKESKVKNQDKQFLANIHKCNKINTSTNQNKTNRKESFFIEQNRNKKLLPHITEEYNNIITNNLLSQKIKLLKRDKLIDHSFHQTANHQNDANNINVLVGKNCRIKTLQSVSMYNPLSTQQKFYSHLIKPYDRNKTAPNKKFKTLKTTFSDLNSSCRNYNDFYTISLENQRMGWRIVNAKSRVQQYLNSTYFTYHLYNGTLINRDKNRTKDVKQKKKVNEKQINNVIKVFFNERRPSNMKTSQNKSQQNIKLTNQTQQFILKQSKVKLKEINQKSNNSQCPKQICLKDKKRETNKYQQCSNDQLRCLNRNDEPSFFRSTYRKSNKPFNMKICQIQKLPVKFNQGKPRSKKFSNQSRINPLMTEPSGDLNQDLCSNSSSPQQIFGIGSILVELKNILIQSNPTLKDDDTLMLQLIQFKSKDKNKDKLMLSAPISYIQFKKGIKFAVNLKLGDFIPLKILKYHGLCLVEVGTLDLNLYLFKNRKKYFCQNNNSLDVDQAKQKITKQSKEGIKQVQLYKEKRVKQSNQCDQERQILYFHSKQRLRKNKKFQIETSIEFDCFIYSKKFNKIKKDKVFKTKNTEIEKQENNINNEE